MYKFIKNNQKKMLAVFGVLLMIVFIIPPAAKYNQQRSAPADRQDGRHADLFR